jgi:membrane-associated phospholipid phosphatase
MKPDVYGVHRADGAAVPAPAGKRPSANSWGGRLATVISMVGSPPVLGIAATGLTASVLSNQGRRADQAWLWAVVSALLAIVAPLAYILWLLRHGRVSDIDLQIREQRARPLVVSVISSGLAWAVLQVGRAPAELVALAAALWVQTAIILGITLRWKISMHSSAAAGAGTLVWALTGTILPLLVLVPLVAWSRVRLRRHTLGQTVAGAALGFAVFSFALALI